MATSPESRTSSSTGRAFAAWPVRLLLAVLLVSFSICLLAGIGAAVSRRDRAPLPPAAGPMPAQAGPETVVEPRPGAPAALESSSLATPTAPASALPAAPAETHAPTPTARAAGASPMPPSPAGPASGPGYIVQPGDSLPQIAAKFKLEPLALMRANHIADPLSITAGQVLVIPPASGQTRRVVVDISEQRLYAYEGDEVVYTFVVSTGANDGTLRGRFSVLDKVENAYSEMWGLWMPDWIGIYYATDSVENGLHALPLDKNGRRLWEDALGQPVSAGCVMLAPQDAQRLYDWVAIGTPVLIGD